VKTYPAVWSTRTNNSCIFGGAVLTVGAVVAVVVFLVLWLALIVLLSIALGSEQARTFVGLFLSTQITTACAVEVAFDSKEEEILMTAIKIITIVPFITFPPSY
jgi:hypothetical protein